ncbi:hypothetical protein GCM10009692_28410 [Leucobacter aridicollis]
MAAPLDERERIGVLGEARVLDAVLVHNDPRRGLELGCAVSPSSCVLPPPNFLCTVETRTLVSGAKPQRQIEAPARPAESKRKTGEMAIPTSLRAGEAGATPRDPWIGSGIAGRDVQQCRCSSQE